MKKLKKNIKNIVIFISLLVLLSCIFAYIKKSESYSIYNNLKINISNYYEKGTAGRGATLASYIFIDENKKYKGAISLYTFKNSSPIVGRNYIVVYNSKNPEQSICFLNLEVHDSIKQYFEKGSIEKIPIESYQHTIDSFLFKRLTGGIGRFFPPYYKKEDFPELEYLWKE